jgi:hypothetical protein
MLVMPQIGESSAATLVQAGPSLVIKLPRLLLHSNEAARCFTAAQPHAEKQFPTRYLLIVTLRIANFLAIGLRTWTKSPEDLSPASPRLTGFPAHHSAVDTFASVTERRALIEQANKSIDNLLVENQGRFERATWHADVSFVEARKTAAEESGGPRSNIGLSPALVGV